MNVENVIKSEVSLSLSMSQSNHYQHRYKGEARFKRDIGVFPKPSRTFIELWSDKSDKSLKYELGPI